MLRVWVVDTVHREERRTLRLGQESVRTRVHADTSASHASSIERWQTRGQARSQTYRLQPQGVFIII